MMRGQNGVGPMTVRLNRERDFAVFDSLPPEVRRAMNESMFKRQAAEVAAMVHKVGAERVCQLLPIADQRFLESEAETLRRLEVDRQRRRQPWKDWTP